MRQTFRYTANHSAKLLIQRTSYLRAYSAGPAVAHRGSSNWGSSTAIMATTAVVDSNKRKALQVGTHSGTFHCDECLGCYLLSQTSQFKDATIIRSRDPTILSQCDVVVDVGGVYDSTSNRFDHHQRGFTEVFGYGFSTKLSSAGLVYKHYGREIVAAAMNLPVDHSHVEAAYLQLYKSFIEAVDAIDNGVNQFDCDTPPKYVNNTTLSARVANLNPTWNQPYTDETLLAGFFKAVQLTGQEFTAALQYVVNSWLPAKHVVVEAISQRYDVDSSGQIITFKQGGAPWKEHLFELEKQMGVTTPILYVLYEDEREKKWRIQAVPPVAGSFGQRKGLPAAWRGLRDEELSRACGIPGCVFVHAGGFIGGNNTYGGVLKMAQKSVAA